MSAKKNGEAPGPQVYSGIVTVATSRSISVSLFRQVCSYYKTITIPPPNN